MTRRDVKAIAKERDHTSHGLLIVLLIIPAGLIPCREKISRVDLTSADPKPYMHRWMTEVRARKGRGALTTIGK